VAERERTVRVGRAQVAAFLLVHVFEGEGFGFVDPAHAHQPARRFRGAEAHEQDDERRHRAEREDEVPVDGKVDGERPGQRIGCQIARIPADLLDRHQQSADLRGREFGQHRPAHGIIGADGNAHDEAHRKQLAGRDDEILGERAQQENRKVDREHRLAADPVGQQPAHGAPDQDADQRRGADQAFPAGGELQVGGDAGHQDADRAQDEAVDEHAARDHEGQPGDEAALPGIVRRNGIGVCGRGRRNRGEHAGRRGPGDHVERSASFPSGPSPHHGRRAAKTEGISGNWVWGHRIGASPAGPARTRGRGRNGQGDDITYVHMCQFNVLM
jgi:hypothetical protein